VAFEDTLIAWSVDETPHRTELLAHSGEVEALAVSSDGRRVASGGEDGTIRLWNRPAGGEPARLEGHRGPVRTLAFSEDGGLLASGADGDRRVILWDVAAQRKRREIETEDEVTAVAISKDGSTLATASENQTSILLWNPNTGERRGELGGHEGHATALVFSADGKTLVSGGTDQAVRVWDLGAGNESGEPVDAGGRVAQLALGAAGTLLASAADWPGDVVLRDLRHGSAARKLPTRSVGGAKRVAVSPDDRLLAFTTDEFGMTIVLWDVERAAPRVDLVASSTINDLAFFPDGRQLASAHFDGRVVLWDVDIKGWPDRACAIANRNLTRDEWQSAVGDSLPYRVACPALPVPKASGE
jgi:WD40 repeat protein